MDEITNAKSGIESGIESGMKSGIENSEPSEGKGDIEIREGGIEGGIEINSTRDRILIIIAKYPYITISELSKRINITRSTIQKHIDALKRLNRIKRVGSTKSGYWMIIK